MKMTRNPPPRVLLTAVPALIMIAANAPAAETDQSTSGVNATERHDILEEVITTARRKEENLQEVPIAITALSQDELGALNIVSVSDLQHVVPSMTLMDYGRDESFASVRGISGLATDGQGVLSYLNEVPLPSGPTGGVGGGGPGLFYDLESLQVLKGPQGTLFGRNTLGGAIVIQTKRPTSTFGGHIETTRGNYDDKEAKFALNVPLIGDALLLRLAGNLADRDGFTRSLGTPDHPDGVDLDNRHFQAGRATVTFRPSEHFRNDLIYDRLVNRNHGTSQILSFVDPDKFAAFLFPELLSVYQQQQALGIRTQVPRDTPTYYRGTFTSLTDIMSVDLSPSVTFRNIASYSLFRATSGPDFDGSIYPVFNIPNVGPYEMKSYTEEAQLQGSTQPLTWTLGGFYLKMQEPLAYQANTILGGTSLLAFNSTIAPGNSKAAYAQGTYDLSSWAQGLSVTAGLRYTWDHKTAEIRNLDGTGGCESGPIESCTSKDEGDFSAPTWTVGLDYRVADDTLLYLTSRRGYHSGGFTPGSPVPRYDSEYLTDVEVGVKSDWILGNSAARTNLSLYHYDYKDVQTFTNQIIDGNSILIFTNAAGAEAWGAEVEGSIELAHALELGAQFTWIDFSYTQFDPGVDPAPLKFIEIQNAPRFKYGVNARYHLPMSEALGDASLSASWNWQSKTVTTAGLGPPDPANTIQDPYGLLTLGANWDHIAGTAFDLTLFVTNALDEEYVANTVDIRGLGFAVHTYGEPRMWGARLRYRFGSDEH